jgi:hypothetical protein
VRRLVRIVCMSVALSAALLWVAAFAGSASALPSNCSLSGTTVTCTSAPSASIATPTNGALYTQGQLVAASYSCSDAAGGPGIAACSGQVANGAAIDTGSLGLHSFTVTATSRDGQAGSATVSYTVIAPPGGGRTPAPSLSNLEVRPQRFRASTTGSAILTAADGGAKITYGDSAAAKTTFRVYRKASATCARHGKRKSCTRWVYVGGFTHQDVAGTNRLRFTGRVDHRALKPGSYRLRGTATMSGEQSRTVTARFKIEAPPTVCAEHDHDSDCDGPGKL